MLHHDPLVSSNKENNCLCHISKLPMFHVQSTMTGDQSLLPILSPLTTKRNLTSSPFLSVFRPDQKRCAHVLTARPWSGFFRSFDAASAHWVLKGSWFSSLKHFILSKVPMIKVIAASCALESLSSSSYRENAWHTHNKEYSWTNHQQEHLQSSSKPHSVRWSECHSHQCKVCLSMKRQKLQPKWKGREQFKIKKPIPAFLSWYFSTN